MRQLEEYNLNRDGPPNMKHVGDWSGQPRARITDLFRKISYIDEKPMIQDLPVLSSTKQIIAEAKSAIDEMVNQDVDGDAK